MTFLPSTAKESDGPYLSPSSLETFDLCARKWAWVKIDGLPRPGSAATDLGTAVHAQHERYLLDGTPYDVTARAGEIAVATQHILPPPGSVAVEEFFRFSYRGIVFGGYLDWHDIVQNVARAGDHKTGARPEYFKLTKNALLGHPQAPIYGVAVAEHYGTDGVRFEWNYATTRGRPVAYPSHHDSTRLECETALDAYIPVAERMLDVLQKRDSGQITTARQLPLPVVNGRNPCEAYGGCPFRAQCNLSTKELSQMANMPNPFARKPATPPAAAAPAPAPAAPPPVAINPPEGDAPPAETAPAAEPAPARRGPGRPPKAKPATVAPISDEGEAEQARLDARVLGQEFADAFIKRLAERLAAIVGAP